MHGESFETEKDDYVAYGYTVVFASFSLAYSCTGLAQFKY